MTAVLAWSVVIGLLSVASGYAVRPLLVARRGGWMLLLAPYLTPTLLVGYAYANFSLSLVRHPVANAVLYSVLLWFKLTPVATLVLVFAPRAISMEAMHCWWLMRGSVDWRFRWKAGCTRAPVVAFALVFLFAFGEFEMASLMGVTSWTVILFDAHAGGLDLRESLRMMLTPMLYEAAVVGWVAWWLGRSRLRLEPLTDTLQPVVHGWLGWLYLIAAFVLVFCVPAAIVLHGTMQGLAVVTENFALSKEIGASLVFAVAAAAGAFWLARWRATAAVAVVGLLGALVLSLVMLSAVQLPVARALRDTPVPTIITLTVVILPFAVLLRLLLDARQPGTTLHVVSLMTRSRSARELAWRLNTRARFWAAFLLFAWAYWDLTVGAILAPVGMTPVTVRLYNLMHYGQTAALSAMVCAAFAAPLIVAAMVVMTRRWWMRS